MFSTPFLHSRWQLQAQGQGSENMSLAFDFLSSLFSFLRADLCLYRGICMFMWVCAFMHANVCACAWAERGRSRPGVTLGVLLYCSLPYSETVSLSEPVVQQFG